VISDEDDLVYNIDSGIKNFKMIMNKDMVKNIKYYNKSMTNNNEKDEVAEGEDFIKVGFSHWFKIVKLITNDINGTQLKCSLDFKSLHKEPEEEVNKFITIQTIKPGMLVSCIIKESYSSGIIVSVANLEGYILKDH